MALENLSETQFKTLTGSYEPENQELPLQSDRLNQEISTEQDKMLNADHFLISWTNTPIAGN